MKQYIITLIIAFIAGCSFTPKLEINTPPVPDKIDNVTGVVGEVDINTEWWKIFNDEKLNKIVDEVIQNNRDIKSATLRVSLALANLGIEDANLYPSVNINAGVSRSSVSKEVSPYREMILNNYNIGASVSYEIDFWGKLRAQKGVAVSQYNASIYDKQTLMISVVSSAVNIYFNIVTLKKQIDVMDKYISMYEETYNYRKKQYENGLISDYTLKQTEVQLLNAKAQVVSMKQSLEQLKSSLSLLAGRNPKDIFEKDISTTNELMVEVRLPIISSKALLERPDIKAAIERVKSSNFNIGTAKALYYPNISLTGSLGFASNELGNLAQSSANFWSLGSVIYFPLLDFGRIKNSVKKSEISLDIAINEYEKVVQNAFKEVYDILNSIRFLNEKKEVKLKEIKNLEEVLAISKRYYDVGRISIFEVLENDRYLLNRKMEMISIENDILNSYVNLYKALGGFNNSN
ncbi:MAG: TolC family protein [Deferribacterales bacterium]